MDSSRAARPLRVTVAAACAAILVGCGAHQATAPALIPTFETTPPPPPPPVTDRQLPKDCVNVAAAPEVDQIIGHPLGGTAQSIVGLPDPNISRTARTDCYYGVPDGKPLETAALVIALATYKDEPTAQERMRATVDAARAHGPTSEVPVGPDHGVVFADGADRVLVDAHGKTTVLITAKSGVLPEDKAGQILAALAVRSLTPHVSPTDG